MSGKNIRSAKLRKKRRRVFFIKMLYLLTLVGVSVGLFIYGFNTDSFKIQNVLVTGGQEFVNKEVEEYTTSNILAGSYFGVLPKQNILIYPKGEIRKKIMNDFPRIEDISFELDPFKKQVLNISIKERQENGVWCRNMGEYLDCYFIDKNGYVFAPAPTYSEGVVFSYYGGIQGSPIGQNFIDTTKFVELNSLIEVIKNNNEINFEPTGLEYTNSGEYKLLLGGGGYVLFSDSYGLAYAYDNLILAASKKEITPDNLDYLDLRIPNKVFYKTRQGSEQSFDQESNS